MVRWPFCGRGKRFVAADKDCGVYKKKHPAIFIIVDIV
jgi:hypothetical protein